MLMLYKHLRANMLVIKQFHRNNGSVVGVLHAAQSYRFMCLYGCTKPGTCNLSGVDSAAAGDTAGSSATKQEKFNMLSKNPLT